MTQPTAKLRLRLDSPRPRLKMIWMRRPDGVLACGPVTIEFRHAKPPGDYYDPVTKDAWYTLVNGVVICRLYGYATERDAQFAAPHLGAVRNFLSKGK